tara:strand:- start:211 stop:876 length:666 start_codon:yes stop_codon:yes gene_type:complete
MSSFLFLFACISSGLQMPGTTRNIGKPSFMEERIVPEYEAASTSTSFRTPTSFRRKGGSKVAESAKKLVGAKSLRVDGISYRYDCSGFVMAAHAKASIMIDGSTKMLYDESKEENVFHHKKKPFVGDVVFFDNSYDRNKNGRRDDKLTHIAIVEKVESDGTMTLIHLGSKGIVRTIMNLYYPDMHQDQNGKVLNSYLRASKSSPNLTGELWVGFGSLWKLD